MDLQLSLGQGYVVPSMFAFGTSEAEGAAGTSELPKTFRDAAAAYFAKLYYFKYVQRRYDDIPPEIHTLIKQQDAAVAPGTSPEKRKKDIVRFLRDRINNIELFREIQNMYDNFLEDKVYQFLAFSLQPETRPFLDRYFSEPPPKDSGRLVRTIDDLPVMTDCDIRELIVFYYRKRFDPDPENPNVWPKSVRNLFIDTIYHNYQRYQEGLRELQTNPEMARFNAMTLDIQAYLDEMDRIDHRRQQTMADQIAQQQDYNRALNNAFELFNEVVAMFHSTDAELGKQPNDQLQPIPLIDLNTPLGLQPDFDYILPHPDLV